LIKLELSRQIFDKYSYIKFYENSFGAGRVVACGQTDGETDRHDEAKRPFRSFMNAATNNTIIYGLNLCGAEQI